MNRSFALVLSAAMLVGVVSGGARSARPSAGAASIPVVVELFTSEGCSSCPAADAVLQDLVTTQPVAGVEVIALGQHVDYWNRLGWKDVFSSKQFTQRQREYAEALGATTYTPQAVVNGGVELVGSQRSNLLRAVARAAQAPRAAVAVRRSGSKVEVSVGALPAHTQPVEVLLALTESGLSSQVGRGENAGRTLAHAAVVRALRPLGVVGANGTFAASVPLNLATDWQMAHMRAVVLVQEQTSRRIVGVGSALLTNN